MSVQIWLGRQDSNLFPDYGTALKDKLGQSPARLVARTPTRRTATRKNRCLDGELEKYTFNCFYSNESSLLLGLQFTRNSFTS